MADDVDKALIYAAMRNVPRTQVPGVQLHQLAQQAVHSLRRSRGSAEAPEDAVLRCGPRKRHAEALPLEIKADQIPKAFSPAVSPRS